ncbi:putative GP46-like surface antigen [Leptomonas pyrrhocoris]|uniref:Putative GP46-like surface antigen n=1 Tax=Leptomonas pyrrhocoris TaxID=157538 RepID=A0A0N0DRK0_LEPPY|nr:putative GP46-like surface antigen [Leptomonas pyrrhocoris]XP_015653023.1 putative GP46-like surface antigen [Leptomonas pyrrhocoris]XP_015653027.1 putative GP46-like surface antigen [Leptomonas pyrrhocoris]KPA74583.1 putative GP46-like surface antigen [Leptomonas pyrrhocoris]KPA74584.1 putative GP46-like surface antigen [Leptomonas pyrrhocoris]KPA74588.1 putative GP46-like surface antigen [Leptomonas pyrrhocoris]|eukprot:XP_015653022.1 putative GP46-like surface antigen [Leptomonas pyrrhocoris]
MAWFNYPLRRMMVAAALLALCVVDASLVNASPALANAAALSAGDNTLQFLQGFALSNPSLVSVWTGTDFCKWPYVICADSGHALNFADADSPAFSGSLVLPELPEGVDGSLVMFVKISIKGMGKKVTGTLPSSWGGLTRLTTLYLHGNALTGPVPAAWSGLKALQYLWLQDNRLDSPLPDTLGTLAGLGSLYLSNNALTGTLPASWSGMAKMATLKLSGNRIEGNLPAEWGSMTKIYTIQLGDNKLSGTLPAAWSGMSSLSELDLSNNKFVGPIPAGWGGMQHLSAVTLTGNDLCGCLPSGWVAPTLVEVKVDAAVSASDCATANHCSTEPSGSASSHTESKKGSSSAPPAPTPVTETLKFLQALVKAVPDLAVSASDEDYCKWYSFVQCQNGVTVRLTDRILSTVSSLPDLADDVNGALVLVISFEANDKGAMLSGTLPPSWGRLTQMQDIKLENNALTGPLPVEWSGMTSLKFLWLDNNGLTGDLPVSWGTLSTVQVLSVRANHLTGPLPSGWSGMTLLRNFYAENNSLTGELPVSWGSLKQMKVVMLTNNKVSGDLPAEWNGMTPLVTLALGNNALSGTLPAVWSSLSKLMQLKLNNNSLSGTLPAEWSKLTRVKNGLLLQGNHFCGCVPPEWAGKLTPTVDPAVSAETCATTNACGKASSSGAGPHSSSHSHPSPSPASSSHSKPSPVVASSSSSSSFECAVVHCLECEAGNSTKCSQCARRYALTDDSQCASKGDAAYWQSLGSPNGWLMLALLCTCVLWNLV